MKMPVPSRQGKARLMKIMLQTPAWLSYLKFKAACLDSKNCQNAAHSRINTYYRSSQVENAFRSGPKFDLAI